MTRCVGQEVNLGVMNTHCGVPLCFIYWATFRRCGKLVSKMHWLYVVRTSLWFCLLQWKKYEIRLFPFDMLPATTSKVISHHRYFSVLKSSKMQCYKTTLCSDIYYACRRYGTWAFLIKSNRIYNTTQTARSHTPAGWITTNGWNSPPFVDRRNLREGSPSHEITSHSNNVVQLSGLGIVHCR